MQDLSYLAQGLSPMSESMHAGNTVSPKGLFQAQGSDSESTEGEDEEDA